MEYIKFDFTGVNNESYYTKSIATAHSFCEKMGAIIGRDEKVNISPSLLVKTEHRGIYILKEF